MSVSTCLLACDQSNVVVSQHLVGNHEIQVDGDDATVDALFAWVREGGPGWTDPPEVVARLAFPPSGLSRDYITL